MLAWERTTLDLAGAEFTADQGVRQFHLGGGMSQPNGLLSFKQTFGGLDLNYGVSGVMIDDELSRSHVDK